MRLVSRRNGLIYLAVAAAGIAVDQISKFLASEYLEPKGSVPIWDGVLRLTYVENTGAAFGMLSDSRWVFMLISTIAIVALSAYLCLTPETDPVTGVFISMIVSGGIGNMIDRIALGYVVDFIDFELIDFYVFNIADSLVCVGAFLFLIVMVRDIIREEKRKRAGGSGEV